MTADSSPPAGTPGTPGTPRALVRPYTLTRGRTATAAAWPPETVVETLAPEEGPDATPTGPIRTVGGVDDEALRALGTRLRGPLWLPGDLGITEEIASSYSAVEHRPRAVVGVRDVDDVVAAVGFAAAHGLPVAVQSTGHGAVAPVDDGLLLSTRRMRELTVDPVRRIARIGAGVVWSEVLALADRYGLAPLCGSFPGVGVAGYTLGGGLSPVARTYGWTADHLVALEVVTPDGVARRVDAEHEPDLFWALRGGKGNFGVVTALELGLLTTPRLYGGGLFFPGEQAAEVLGAYPGWAAALPERTTTSIALSHLGAARGGGPPSVHLRVAHLGDPAEGARLLAPMRALGPAVDTVAELGFPAVGSIHDDPTEPAAVWKRGVLLAGLPPAGVDAVLAAVGPDAPDPVAAIEIRHLGGALAREPAVPNAVGGRDAAFGVFVVDRLESDGSASRRGRALVDSLDPFATGGATPNFLGSVTDADLVATAWDRDTHRRLVALKGRWDPQNLFRFGYAVPLPDPSAPATVPRDPEARAILRMCRPWRSLAEIGALLELPLGVVRVLLTDLAEAGLVRVHPPSPDPGRDLNQLERVLRGLRNRL